MPTQTPEKWKLFASTLRKAIRGVLVGVQDLATPSLRHIAARLLRSGAHVLSMYAALRCSQSNHTAPQSGRLHLAGNTQQRLRILAVGFLAAVLVSTGLGLFMHASKTSAATSGTVNFQARLMSGTGAIAADGYYNVEFNLYSASTGGTSLWTEDYLNSNGQGLKVANGYLSANLGSVTAFPSTINWDQNLYLGMTVRGTGNCSFGSCTPGDAEMTPRLKMTATPYAFAAGKLAQYNSGNSYTSTLSLQTPTGGNQNFVIQDQGAAGTYNLLTTNQANTGYIQNTTVQQTATLSIISGGAANAVASFQGAPSQTADLLDVRDGSGNLKVSIGSSGILTTATGSTLSTATNTFQGGGSTNSSVSIKAKDSGQTGDLLRLQDYSGNTLSKIDVNGRLTLGRIATSGVTKSGSVTLSDGTLDGFGLTVSTSTLTANRAVSFGDEAGTICLQNSANCGFLTSAAASSYIQLQASSPVAQTGNLAITGSGSVGSLQAGSSSQFQVDGSGNVSTTGQSILGGGSNQAQVIIKANSSQTSGNPLLVLKDSGGGELARITSDNYTDLFIGNSAGASSNGGINYNTFIGSSSGVSTTSGRFNAALGYNSLAGNTDGNNNTAFGENALQNANSAYNSAFGSNAAKNITSGYDNTAFGADSLQSVTSGINNTAIGAAAGSVDYNGNFSTAATIQNSTAIGAYAQVQQNNSIVLGSVDLNTKVGIGTTQPQNTFSVSPVADSGNGSSVKASQSGTTVTGTGTSWTSALVGMRFIFADGDSGTITAVASTTSLTLDTSQTETNQAYRIHTVGFQVTSGGNVYVQTTSTTAFQIQGINGSAVGNLFTADTSNITIKVSGSTDNFAIFQLDNAHFKSTQTTSPTVSTPLNCGSSPTATVTAGSTDAAGSFTVTTGGGGGTTCDTTLTFNKPYGAAPKAILVTPQSATGGSKMVYVSGSTATTFTIKYGTGATAPGAAEANTFSYWVVE